MIRRVLGLFLLVVLVGIGRAQDRDARLFKGNDHVSFRQLKEAQESLRPESWNSNLVAAAIFHETNRRRLQNDRPALKYDLKVRRAASLQAQAMADGGFVGHVNPNDPSLKTLEDRARAAQLNPRFVAENVAMTSARDYVSGKAFYVREEGGDRVYSYRPDGPPIERHTYLSFAEALVEEWMKSEGHRHNILHEMPRFLGCSAILSLQSEGLDMIYSAQVFYTPLKTSGAPAAAGGSTRP